MRYIEIVLAAVLIFKGCKQPVASKVQTLDNFTRAEGSAVKRNQCIGNTAASPFEPLVQVADTADARTQARVIRAVGASLTSIPESVLTLFFSAGGIIRAAPDVASVCADKLRAPIDRYYAGENGAVKACWDVEPQGIRIYVGHDTDAIRHHLVRMFGRVMSEVLADAPRTFDAATAAKMPQFTAGAARMRDLRAKLKDAFVREALAQSGHGGSPRFRTLLGTAEGQEIYEHYVFAEAFDSYYCTSAPGGTRADFASGFPATYAAFLPIARALAISPDQERVLNALGKLSGVQAAAEPASDLALTNPFDSGWRWFDPRFYMSKLSTGYDLNYYYGDDPSQMNKYERQIWEEWKADQNLTPEQRREKAAAVNDPAFESLEEGREKLETIAENPVAQTMWDVTKSQLPGAEPLEDFAGAAEEALEKNQANWDGVGEDPEKAAKAYQETWKQAAGVAADGAVLEGQLLPEALGAKGGAAGGFVDGVEAGRDLAEALNDPSTDPATPAEIGTAAAEETWKAVNGEE